MSEPGPPGPPGPAGDETLPAPARLLEYARALVDTAEMVGNLPQPHHNRHLRLVASARRKVKHLDYLNDQIEGTILHLAATVDELEAVRDDGLRARAERDTPPPPITNETDPWK